MKTTALGKVGLWMISSQTFNTFNIFNEKKNIFLVPPWDLNSPTRDLTQALNSERLLTTGPASNYLKEIF